ncbi:hypothetical protein C3461_24270, partial [Serratia marcescens]
RVERAGRVIVDAVVGQDKLVTCYTLKGYGVRPSERCGGAAVALFGSFGRSRASMFTMLEVGGGLELLMPCWSQPARRR